MVAVAHLRLCPFGRALRIPGSGTSHVMHDVDNYFKGKINKETRNDYDHDG